MAPAGGRTPGRAKVKVLWHLSAVRIIAHLDMDAFYASVEARANPELRDRPLVVGADPKEGRGRGVVTAASYLARRYGIRSATPISRAWRLAEAARRRGEPETVFVRDHRALYVEVSGRIMALLVGAADAFQAASIDEAYLDLSGLGSFAAAVERATELKRAIGEREGLTCSIGLGPNKLVAKIASDFQKPDGLTVVEPDRVQDFLDPLPIRVIPGIGPKTERALHARGHRFVRDLRQVPEADLVAWFGRWGRDLHAKVRGISDSPVSNEREAKSVGEQETFEVDSLDPAFILERLRGLAREVFTRLQRHQIAAFRTTTVTVRFTNFRTCSRAHTSREPLTTEDALYEQAVTLLLPFLDERENPRQRKIRLIGVRAEKLLRPPLPDATEDDRIS
jgi:nucleotidyltransferase/DNA polymerase involved in DNA repair